MAKIENKPKISALDESSNLSRATNAFLYISKSMQVIKN
jgi:hypothetical protein